MEQKYAEIRPRSQGPGHSASRRTAHIALGSACGLDISCLEYIAISISATRELREESVGRPIQCNLQMRLYPVTLGIASDSRSASTGLLKLEKFGHGHVASQQPGSRIYCCSTALPLLAASVQALLDILVRGLSQAGPLSF